MDEKVNGSEEKYSFLINNILDVIMEMDLNGNILYLSPQVNELLGFLPEQGIGANGFDFVHPDDLQGLKATFARVLNIKSVAMVEFRLRHKKGHYIPVSVRGRVVKSNNEFKIMMVIRDNTEYKVAEQKLRESEEKYRVITESANDIISIINEKFETEYQNEEATYNILGYTNEEILNQNALERLHPDEVNKVVKIFREGFKKGEAQAEMRSKHKNGDYVWFDIKGRTFIDQQGQKKGIIISRDISERKKMEKKLRESEERYRDLYNNAEVGLFQTRITDGKVIAGNQKCAELVGYNNIEDFLNDFIVAEHYVDTSARKKMIEEIKRSGQISNFEAEITDRFGKPHWWSYSARLNNAKGVIEGVAVDITERKKAQEKLKEAFDRETFLKKLFTHDINSVLNNIQNSLSLFTLYQNNPDKQDELRKIVNILKEQVVRGAHLVSNIRQLSELEEDKAPLGSTDVMQFLHEAIQIVQEGFQTRIIDVNIDSQEDTILVRANNLLLNVFENILNNAVKYNEHPIVEILIQISKQSHEGINYAKFEFKDNGIGIDASKKATIFEEGYKKEKGEKGLGFGLSLVKKIIENYEGQIWVEEKIKGEHSKGSNFVLLIPLY
jgi:PAS domain S-box-containing protein